MYSDSSRYDLEQNTLRVGGSVLNILYLIINFSLLFSCSISFVKSGDMMQLVITPGNPLSRKAF